MSTENKKGSLTWKDNLKDSSNKSVNMDDVLNNQCRATKVNNNNSDSPLTLNEVVTKSLAIYGLCSIIDDLLE